MVRTYLFSDQADIEFLLWNAFVPGRFGNDEILGEQGLSAYWTFVSYSLLHADWLHLAMNGFWMLAFGSAVAQRIGSIRFIVLLVLASISGAVFHLMLHLGEFVPMIGASAAVSACMGAACRFAFPKGRQFRIEASSYPIQSLSETFSNQQAMIFILFWFVINFLFGSGIVDVSGTGSRIAWEAHIGGFLFGLFGLPLLARRSKIHSV